MHHHVHEASSNHRDAESKDEPVDEISEDETMERHEPCCHNAVFVIHRASVCENHRHRTMVFEIHAMVLCKDVESFHQFDEVHSLESKEKRG